MRDDLVWYHVIWNTHGSWLPGDPRGFRNRDHRIHSSGDYRKPPPIGEHQNLLRYNQARSVAPIQLPTLQRSRVVESVLETIAQFECSAAALSVASEHVHLLAALPHDYDVAKAVVGKCKTYSSLALRDVLPGSVWARGRMMKRVNGGDHWDAVFRYITQKQEREAVLWNWDDAVESREELRPGKKSTACAVASDAPTTPSLIKDEPQLLRTEAAAQAANSSIPSDLNHFTQSDAVEVRRVTNRGKGGRAVIARRDIAEGELIERVPVLMIPRTQVFGPGDIAGRAARISWYVFEWLETKRGYVALSLGYGSIYNHSDTPNAAYDMEPPDIMLFTAIKPIRAGEEVLISYAGAAGATTVLGFDVEETPSQEVESAPSEPE